jgi:SMC interacting uncharacterized protein involved in chromosome segregation
MAFELHIDMNGQQRRESLGDLLDFGKALVPDGRPMSTRALVHAVVPMLSHFFIAHNYPHDVAAQLQTPTQRGLQQLMTFVIRLLDPAFPFSEQRAADEIHGALKLLR